MFTVFLSQPGRSVRRAGGLVGVFGGPFFLCKKLKKVFDIQYNVIIIVSVKRERKTKHGKTERIRDHLYKKWQ